MVSENVNIDFTKISDLPSNDSNCAEIKTGIFVSGTDTITRYFKSGYHYQYYRIGSETLTTRIEWISDCRYITISDNGSVTSRITLENIHFDTHEWNRMSLVDEASQIPSYVLVRKSDSLNSI
jgi:hypothetical protein